MGLHVEHLDTDVIRARIQMVLHSFANRFHVTPCDERVDQTVAALPQEVVVGEAEASPVVDVVRQSPATLPRHLCRPNAAELG